MSALDKQVEVSPSLPWGPAWLNRTLPALHTGTSLYNCALTLAICTLGFMAFFRSRRLSKQIQQNPSDRSALFTQLNKRLLPISRGHFYIAYAYLLGVGVIAGVDAYVSYISLKDDLNDHSEVWTAGFVLELAGYMVGLCVLLVGVLVLVPFMQVCFAFWLLTRSAQRHGDTTLTRYIPEARIVSTTAAQVWAMFCYFLQAWTSDELGVWRSIVLLAAIGSTFAWLHVSHAFNFRADRLQDKEIDMSSDGVRDVVAKFGRTMMVLYAKGENAALLPKYEVVQQDAVVDEKMPA